jgi:hypothetical protein
MQMSFADISEFERQFNDRQMTYQLNKTKCECGDYREMSFQQVLVKIGGYSIEIVDCPTMVCPTCGSEDICPDIPKEIYNTYFQMERKGYNSCRLTMKSDERFQYAEKAQFKYDSRDMSIPGIAVDADPSHPRGFSCPVYFDRRVLNSFSSDPDYKLDFFSESYGKIG